MGLLDFARRKALSASPTVLEALSERQADFGGLIAVGPRPFGTNPAIEAAWVEVQSATYGWLYVHSPAVREVVDFIARNVAQLPLRLLRNVSATETEEVDDHPALETLRNPNDNTPAEQFISTLVSNWLVYANSYVLKMRGAPGGPLTLMPLSSSLVGVIGRNHFFPEAYRIWRDDGTYFDVEPGNVLHWREYNPTDQRKGISPLETLRKSLAEDAAAQEANLELMKSGLAQQGWLGRPIEAPQISEEGIDRLVEDWAAQNKRGRTPLLEEGTEFHPYGYSPRDAEMLDGRRFTKEEVCGIYGVPLGLMGLGDQQSQLADQHDQFYGDLLAPLTQKCAAYLTLGLLRQEFDEQDLFFTLDMDAKLQGNERIKTLTAAAGAAPLTRNEVREMLDRPPIDGGDELITPLNVVVGDNPKPAPNVMPVQDPNGPPQDGSARNEIPPPQGQSSNGSHKALEVTTKPRRASDMSRQRRYVDETVADLERFYTRQLDAIRAKSFDSARWNRELTDVLGTRIASIVEREGGIYTARLGGDDFDARQTEHYIETMAGRLAERLNAVTQRDFEGDATAREALERAIGARAAVAGTQIAAKSTFFSRQEAARQSPSPGIRVQTWIANTDRHADLDGVTVPLGSDWGGIEPGSEPNCGCSASIV